MKSFILIAFASLAFAQQNVDEAINSIFLTNATFDDFLQDYEEVTPAPLKSYGALTKCGEGDQKDRFVCVPYFNCNITTNTVQENPDADGSNRIDIRFGDSDSPKCDHYMEVCCQASANMTGNGGEGVTSPPILSTQPTPPTRPTTVPTISGVVTPPTTVVTPPTNSTGQRAFCGIRNSQGLDFNLIGGTNEALFGEFPWMVAILRKNPSQGQTLAICGGSLITPRVVLTGAHCVNSLNIGDIKIRAGEWDTQTQNERIPYQERNVVQKIVHKDFFKSNLYNDMALLILERPLAKTESIGTICLPKQNQKINSRECFATGWGKDRFGREGNYAVLLKKIQLPLVENKQCSKALKKTRLGNSFVLHRSFICAGGEAGADTCTGDGGSPLVCPDPSNPGRYVQAGMVAWGIGCGENQVPGVYVDVAQFRNWVDLKLQELEISSISYN